MEEVTVAHQGSRAVLRLHADGVLGVVMSGPLTPGAITAIKAAATSSNLGPVRAFLADYTRCAIVLDGAQLDAVLLGEDPATEAARFPAALVVRADCMDLFMGHALRMAQLGVMRRVFFDQQAALHWAQAMAAPRCPSQNLQRQGA